jgi:hypothetical protein
MSSRLRLVGRNITNKNNQGYELDTGHFNKVVLDLSPCGGTSEELIVFIYSLSILMEKGGLYIVTDH